MPTTRLYTYAPPLTVVQPGVVQYGNVFIQDFSDPSYPYIGADGLQWLYGPDEDLGYIITREFGPATRGPGATFSKRVGTGIISGTSVGWWRSASKTDNSFIDLTKKISTKYGRPITISNNDVLNPSVYYAFDPSVGLSGYGAKLWLTDPNSGNIFNLLDPFWTSYPAPTDWLYYKWQILGVRSGAATYSHASEFVFMIDGVTQSVSTITRVMDRVENNAEYLIDDNLTTRWLDGDFLINGRVSNIIFEMEIAKAYNGYRWSTPDADSSASTGRDSDPITWKLWGSLDSIDWTLLHDVVNYPTPNSRKTWTNVQIFKAPTI